MTIPGKFSCIQARHRSTVQRISIKGNTLTVARCRPGNTLCLSSQEKPIASSTADAGATCRGFNPNNRLISFWIGSTLYSPVHCRRSLPSLPVGVVVKNGIETVLPWDRSRTAPSSMAFLISPLDILSMGVLPIPSSHKRWSYVARLSNFVSAKIAKSNGSIIPLSARRYSVVDCRPAPSDSMRNLYVMLHHHLTTISERGWSLSCTILDPSHDSISVSSSQTSPSRQSPTDSIAPDKSGFCPLK